MINRPTKRRIFTACCFSLRASSAYTSPYFVFVCGFFRGAHHRLGSYSAWLHPKDMSALLPHEIEAFLADDNKKRNGELHKGYQIALDSAEFVRQQKNNVRALKESMDNAQVDQLESEGEEGGEGDEDGATVVKKSKGSTSKKRKRDSEAEPAKAKRGPKTTKKDSVEPVKKKSAPGKTARKNGAKSKALVESEDDGAEAEDDDDDDAGPSKKTSPPPAKKAKRDKEDADYGVFFSLGSIPFRCYVAYLLEHQPLILLVFLYYSS